MFFSTKQEDSWRSGDERNDGYENQGYGRSGVYRGSVKYHNSGARAYQEESEVRQGNLRENQRGFNEDNIRRFATAGDAPPSNGPPGVNLGAFSVTNKQIVKSYISYFPLIHICVFSAYKTVSDRLLFEQNKSSG